MLLIDSADAAALANAEGEEISLMRWGNAIVQRVRWRDDRDHGKGVAQVEACLYSSGEQGDFGSIAAFRRTKIFTRCTG